MMMTNAKCRLLAVCLLWGSAASSAGAMETLLSIRAGKDTPRISEGDLVRLSDGRLCVVYSRFTGGGGDDAAADLAMQTSADNGKTWSPVRLLVRNEGKCNVMSVSLLRLDREILLFYLRKDSPGTSCNLFVRRSRDELATVSEPVRVTLLEGYHVVNNNRVVRLSSGRILAPAVLHTGFDASGKVTPFVGQGVPMVYYSDDEGRTWQKDETPVTPTNQRKLTLQENGVVELAAGRVWMFMRTAHGSQYGCYSTDQGIHWSEPQPTALASPCSPASITRMPWTGQLACVWNDYRGDHPFTPPRRTPLCLATSDDDGRTWSKSIVLEGDPKGCFCYTSMTWDKDRLYLTYGAFTEWKVVSLAKDWIAQRLSAAQGGQARPKAAESLKQPLIAEALDYGRSYVNTKAEWNSPRFAVESRLRITDAGGKTTREYLQCGSCKSEYTFPALGLFHADNYDFLPIFSQVDCLIFRRHLTERDRYREVKPVAAAWGGTVPAVRCFRGRVLRDVGEISAAMTAGKPLVGQTEIRDQKSGRTAVIEYPIKTINWQRETGQWQVDTGPVLLPDLTVPPEQWSQKIRLAYVAFNAPDWAEFIVEEPTPIRAGGKEAARVYHYLGQLAAPARNVILAQD